VVAEVNAEGMSPVGKADVSPAGEQIWASRQVSPEDEGVLTPSRGLDAGALSAIAALEAEVVAADGGRLKLEWGVLESRDPGLVQDLLWWEGDRLLGFAGVYAFGQPQAEVAGMVAPDARRRGVGSALLAAVGPLCRDLGCERMLLVTPRGTAAGRAFAQAHGAVLDHSEHFLVLGTAPNGLPLDKAVTLRRAVPEDEPVVRSLLREAFDGEPPEQVLDRHGDATHVVERAGEPVGTIRLSIHGEVGAVYGFAVHPAVQGQGVGRDVLGRACRQLYESGCTRITLEVETENEQALGLYTSTGFVAEAGEDYWALPTGA
jgi:ribosomal protein S18 acetylase RimI-like enzyme